MKTKLWALLICMSSLQMIAQEANPKHKTKVNELGLGFRFPAQTSTDRNGVELLYKRWFRPWQAYRISAGFNNEDLRSAVWYRAVNSQVIKTEEGGRNHFAFISGGLEAQRQFYKRVYLYAATDLRLMYGKGRNYSKMYTLNDSLGITHADLIPGSTSSYATTNFRGELVGSLGAKINFPRISCGFEVYNAVMSYSGTTSSLRSVNNTNLFDFNLGAISNRAFVTWRF